MCWHIYFCLTKLHLHLIINWINCKKSSGNQSSYSALSPNINIDLYMELPYTPCVNSVNWVYDYVSLWSLTLRFDPFIELSALGYHQMLMMLKDLRHWKIRTVSQFWVTFAEYFSIMHVFHLSLDIHKSNTHF